MAKTSETKTTFQEVRDELGLSRLEAANLIAEVDNGKYGYLDENKLVKIEHGTVKVQPDDVVALSKAYNRPELRNYYCCHQCSIGKLDTPEVDDANNVHKTLVEMSVSLESINAKKMRLMEILADGKVDDTEILDLNKILEELEKISMAVEAIQIWCEKMKVIRNEEK